MRIVDRPRPAPPTRPGRSHPADAVGHRRRPSPRRRRTPRQSSPSGARHLRVGTAQRALNLNLAHLRHCLADPRLPQDHRQVLEQSVSALQASLQDHRALRTHMAAVILG